MDTKYKSSTIAIKENSTMQENSFKDKVAELEKLVELAENVSKNIDDLVEQRTNLFYYSAISIFLFVSLAIIFRLFYAGTYQSLVQQGILSWLTLVISMPFLVYLAKNYSTRYKLSEKIYGESLVLNDLFGMIHPYKESIFIGHSNLMKKAVIDMKLNRVKFSNGNLSNPKEQKSILKKVVDFV